MAGWAVVLAGFGDASESPFITRSWVIADRAEADRAADTIRASIGSRGWRVDVAELIEAASAAQIIDHFSAIKRIYGEVLTGIEEVSPGLFRFKYED